MNHSHKIVKIVPLERKGIEWLEARDLVRDKGGLPSNLQHDEIILSKDQSQREKLASEEYNVVWAREVLIYPAPGQKFRQGFDIVDKYPDEQGRRWAFPAEFVPEAACKHANFALMVDPVKVELMHNMVLIIPKSIDDVRMIGPLTERPAGIGKSDQTTRIPIEDPAPRTLPEWSQKMHFRSDGESVRPIARNYNKGNRHDIFTAYDPCCKLKVGYVEQAYRPEKTEISKDNLPLFKLCKKITDRDENVKPFEGIEEFTNFLIGRGSEVWTERDEKEEMTAFLAISDDVQKDNSLEVLMIGVDPDLQHKGYGSRLMEFAEQLAMERGRKKIFLFTTTTNETAIRFYEKLGYVRVSQVENHYDDGKARYLFEKRL